MSQAIANPTFTLNNASVFIVPNSLEYNEGFGEYKVRSQSGGGGTSETVFSEDAESKISGFKVDFYPTKENIEIARQVKANRNANAATITDDGFTRSFNNVAILPNYDVPLGADSQFTLEFMGDPAV